MAIHQLTTANMACLDRLAPEVFDNVIDPVQLARFVGDPRHLMLVAIEDDLVVGMASTVEYFHPDKPPQMWI
jgi:aminoglycoside 6'-N-acetyltransferase I